MIFTNVSIRSDKQENLKISFFYFNLEIAFMTTQKWRSKFPIIALPMQRLALLGFCALSGNCSMVA